WYDTAMDRVAGRYRRHAQVMLLLVGFALAVAANLDTWAIARDLATDEPKRRALLASANRFVAARATAGPSAGADAAAFMNAVSSSPLPSWSGVTGWSSLGWLVTAFAISLGAPFWFDLLNKVMVIRGTVKPTEKSPDEASADRSSLAARETSSTPTV